MNIHITCTPEFDNEKVNEVIDLLNEVSGIMSFKLSKPFSEKRAKRYLPENESIHLINSLSFDQLFHYIEEYREEKEIEEAEFIVVITSVRNNLNWFSAFRGRNIFVHGSEWDMFSNVDAKYSIAHQIVENIFQSLINLDIDDVENEPNVHIKPIGCINDFCGDKLDIKLKFKAADICESCIERAIDYGVSDAYISHILEILDFIRKQFILQRRFAENIKPDVVIVKPDGALLIGGKEIQMDDLPKTLYIFFLMHPEGLTRKELCRNVREVIKIYDKLRPGYDGEESIQEMCCIKIFENHRLIKTIEKPKLAINKRRAIEALQRGIGEALGKFYAIHLVKLDNENIYKVNITPDNIKIDSSFI